MMCESKGVGMTKKDYIALAASIRKNYYEIGDLSAEAALRYFAIDLCTILKEDNERFDKTRFLTACGLTLD
jgi:hypothetical protein